MALTYKLNVLETDFPVIKLEFDISEIENVYFVETEKWIDEEKSKEEIDKICVDITIDDASKLNKNHFGKNCWDFVIAQLEMYSPLRPVCLILKRLLWKSGLNIPYKGGLGSYSLFLMLLHVHKIL